MSTSFTVATSEIVHRNSLTPGRTFQGQGSIIDQRSGYWVKLEAWKEDVSDKGVHYEFKDAQTLIDDFFRDVDCILLEVKKKCRRS